MVSISSDNDGRNQFGPRVDFYASFWPVVYLAVPSVDRPDELDLVDACGKSIRYQAGDRLN